MQRLASILPFPGGRLISHAKDGHAQTTIQISGDALAKELMTDYSPFVGRALGEPKLELLELCWRMQGPSGRPFECGIYETDAPGVELRSRYCDSELAVIRTQLVGNVVLARVLAEQWRLNILASGFDEIPIA